MRLIKGDARSLDYDPIPLNPGSFGRQVTPYRCAEHCLPRNCEGYRSSASI